MANQKMDLEKLYQERFQTFELETSTGVNSLLKQKIKYAKTIQLIKWMAIAVITTTAVAIITFLSLNSDDTQELTNLPENLSTIEVLIENLNTDTHQISSAEITDTQQTNENLSQTKETVLIDEPPLKEEENKIGTNNEIIIAKEEDNQTNKNDSQLQDIAADNETTVKTDGEEIIQETVKTEDAVLFDALAEENLEEANDDQENTEYSQPINELDKNSIREALGFKYLEYKTTILSAQENTIDWQQKDLDLFPTNTLDPKSEKSKSGKYQLPDDEPFNNKPSNLSGYFDLHFSPLLWQNQANLAAPELDTSWTYHLNHQAQLSYEMGFSFQLHHDKTPLFLQLGLDYQILKEKIDFQLLHTFEDPELSYWTYDSTFDYQQVIDTFYVIIDSNHFVIDTIFTQDTILTNIDTSYFPVMSSEEKSKKYVNTYAYLNIPLMLGYEFKSKNDHWRFQILAGASLAINLTNEGYYYTKTGDFETYSGKVTPSFIWNLQAAANINYKWKKWQFFLQPEFQYQLNENQLADRIPKRKYRFYKLKLGLRFKLF